MPDSPYTITYNAWLAAKERATRFEEALKKYARRDHWMLSADKEKYDHFLYKENGWEIAEEALEDKKCK